MGSFKHNINHLIINGGKFISTIPLKSIYKNLFNKVNNINYENGLNSSGDSSPDIYFIMLWGQSNNTSRYTISGNLPALQQGVQTGIYNWAYNSGTPQFQAYESGVNDSYGTSLVINGSSTDYTNQTGKFGIGNSLAYTLYNTYNKPCYIVQQAVGGTGLDASFTPLTWDCNTSNNLYNQALSASIAAMVACKAANPNAVIKPVLLWIQGESDAYTSQATANAYEANLTAFINKSRTDLSAADSIFTNVDWIITSLRADTVSYPYRDVVQRAQVAVSLAINSIYLHYMNTARTPISSDFEHYTPITSSFVGQLAAVNAGYDLAAAFNLLYEPIVDTGYIQYLGVNTSTSGDYKFIDFDTHGILKILHTGGKTIDNYLVVGGGGSGGLGVGTAGGGGAGGQTIPGTAYSVIATNYPIYIGNGGGTVVSTLGKGINGSLSSFNAISALGGGYGGGYDVDANGGNAGNGGGAGDYTDLAVGGIGGTGTFSGGNGFTYTGGAGGGAGAGQNGQNGTLTAAGNGGNGYTWIDGITYAGGGGGASVGAAFATNGSGGSGGGGAGQLRNPLGTAAVSGTDGLGAGGGGLCGSNDPGSLTTGGKGRCKLRIKFQN